MKSIILTSAASLLVGCGESQQSSTVEPAEPAELVTLVPEERAPASSPTAEMEASEAEPAVEVAEPTPDADVEIEEANRALRAAAMDGDIQGMREQLAAGADVNARDANGRTLYEVGVKDEATASFLRKQGAKTSRELQLEGD